MIFISSFTQASKTVNEMKRSTCAISQSPSGKESPSQDSNGLMNRQTSELTWDVDCALCLGLEDLPDTVKAPGQLLVAN